MTFIVREEPFELAYPEALPLLQDHWDEIALNKDKITLNPDLDTYESLDEQGSLRVYVARQDGEMVGYFVLIVQRSLHYRDHFFAVNDILFLHRDHRKGLQGLKLIRHAVNALRAEGASLIVVNTKVHKDFGVLLHRLGFNQAETVHTLYVGS